MNFWAQNNEPVNGSAEMGGGEIKPIPAGTQVVAIIDEAKFDTYQNEQTIKLRWVIVDGEYKNRKIFHKLRVYDTDSEKAKKAQRMLLAIDHNCGGKLRQLGREPTDAELLMALSAKPMLIKLNVWEIDDQATGEKKSGNWIVAVNPVNGAAPAAKPAAPAAPAAAAFDEDIGF